MVRRILLTGCSGGGKSTLLEALAEAGFATVPEPGRAIVREEQAKGGTALPWVDAPAFSARVLDQARADYDAASAPLTVFDRGIVDALVWHRRSDTPLLARHRNLAESHPYDPTVLLAPPWPEHYASDSERKLPFEAALEEYTSLEENLPRMGYRPVILPKVPVPARVAIVRAALALESPS
ncbi:MAG: AAA family ATPase [Pseudomonadota bacterium]